MIGSWFDIKQFSRDWTVSMPPRKRLNRIAKGFVVKIAAIRKRTPLWWHVIDARSSLIVVKETPSNCPFRQVGALSPSLVSAVAQQYGVRQSFLDHWLKGEGERKRCSARVPRYGLFSGRKSIVVRLGRFTVV
jgi:hypothetical protein